MKSGKDLNQDLKTLKDLSIQPSDQHITIIVSLRNEFEMDIETQKAGFNHDAEAVMSAVETIKMFIGEMGIEDSVIRLAVQKNNLNVEDAANMLFDPDRVQDLIDEL